MERTREGAAGGLLGTFAGDATGAPWEGSQPEAGRSARGEHPEVDQDELARTFLEHHEPGRGYGGGMLRLLDVWRSGTPVRQATTAVFPEGSFGNGAAMGAAPVGVLWAHDRTRLETGPGGQRQPDRVGGRA